jgi:hypothetical protein
MKKATPWKTHVLQSVELLESLGSRARSVLLWVDFHHGNDVRSKPPYGPCCCDSLLVDHDIASNTRADADSGHH